MTIKNQKLIILLLCSGFISDLNSYVDNNYLVATALKNKINNSSEYNFVKNAQFTPMAAAGMFGLTKLPSIIPECEINTRFRNPIERAYKLLSEKVRSVELKRSEFTNPGQPFLAIIKNDENCFLCRESMGNVFQKQEVCFKTSDNKFLHKNCATRCGDEVVEVIPVVDNINLYDVLSIESDASSKEIESAYLNFQCNNIFTQDDADKSYAVLSSERHRFQYDHALNKNESNGLPLSFSKSESLALSEEFRTLAQSISFMYGVKDNFMARAAGIGSIVSGFEETAKTQPGFQKFLEIAVNPFLSQKGNSLEKAIIEKAEGFSFLDKVKFLTACFDKTMVSGNGSTVCQLMINTKLDK